MPLLEAGKRALNEPLRVLSDSARSLKTGLYAYVTKVTWALPYRRGTGLLRQVAMTPTRHDLDEHLSSERQPESVSAAGSLAGPLQTGFNWRV